MGLVVFDCLIGKFYILAFSVTESMATGLDMDILIWQITIFHNNIVTDCEIEQKMPTTVK